MLSPITTSISESFLPVQIHLIGVALGMATLPEVVHSFRHMAEA
jgi:hypothetical protein